MESPDQAEGEGVSTQDKHHQFYFVKFNPHQDKVVESKTYKAGNLYRGLKGDCRNLRKKIDQKKGWIRELDHLAELEKAAWKILAWKNKKLIVEVKVLKRRGLGKHPQQKNLERRDNKNLQNIIRHRSKSLRSEEKILKEMSNTGSERLRNDDAILALKEPTNIINQFHHLVGRYSSWNGYNKTLIKAQFVQECEAITEGRRIWLEDTDKIALDEKQMKLLMQDTIRLMCIIMEVTREVLDAVEAEMKKIEEKREEDIASLKNKLADFELRKDELSLNHYQNASYTRHVLIMNEARRLAEKKDVEALHELSKTEIEKFMLNWSSNKGFRDGYQKMNGIEPS